MIWLSFLRNHKSVWTTSAQKPISYLLWSWLFKNWEKSRFSYLRLHSASTQKRLPKLGPGTLPSWFTLVIACLEAPSFALYGSSFFISTWTMSVFLTFCCHFGLLSFWPCLVSGFVRSPCRISLQLLDRLGTVNWEAVSWYKATF